MFSNMENKMNNNKHPDKETTRIEAFSDGVFAIAITLLILELIAIMHPQNDETLLNLLLNNWQSLMAFAIGFLTILICWINHHLIFTYINKSDSNLMWVNGFVLFVVTFTPFPTAILAGYFVKEQQHAMAFFGFNYFLMSLAAYCITAYTYNKHLIAEDSRELYFIFKKIWLYCSLYTFIIFFVCFISVPVAIFFYCLMFVVFAYPKEFATRILKRKHNRKK